MIAQYLAKNYCSLPLVFGDGRVLMHRIAPWDNLLQPIADGAVTMIIASKYLVSFECVPRILAELRHAGGICSGDT